jgi:hypothetical protein
MNSGLSLQIRQKWNRVYWEYMDFINDFFLKMGDHDSLSLLGQINVVKVFPDLFIINGFTKLIDSYQIQPNYSAIQEVFKKTKTWMEESSFNQITMPRIGSEKPGNSWENIKPLLAEIFKGTAINISVYYK